MTPFVLLGAALSAYIYAPAPPSAETFDKAAAWQHLVKQCDLGPRVPGTTAHESCRAYLVQELKRNCDRVWEQPFSHRWSVSGSTLKMQNVIGEMNWQNAKVRVLLTAHWDSRPFADQDRDPANNRKPVLGANDGASGVAVLLELSRALKGKLKDVGVMIFLNDGEDLGPDIEEMLLGADYFGKHMPTLRPDYGILLDMIGDKDLSVPMELYSLQKARTLVTAFYNHAKEIGLGSAFPKTPGEWIIDDHKPLNEAGIPTMDLIDFTYTPWHTADDTPAHCSADSLGKVGKALETWLLKPTPFRPKPATNAD